MAKKLSEAIEGQNLNEVMEKAVKNLEAMKRPGQTVVKDAKKLKNIPNVSGQAQNALQEGDIICFPQDMEKLVYGMTFNTTQRNPTLVCGVAVLRGTRTLGIPLYITAFTRRFEKITEWEDAEQTVVKSTESIYPTGEPAELVQQCNEDAMTAFCQLAGRYVRVSGAPEEDVMVIPRDAKQNEDGSFPTEPGKRKVLDYEFVELDAEVA